MLLRWLWPLSPAIVLGAAFLVLTRFVRRNVPIAPEISLDRSVTARAPADLINLSHAIDVQHWVFVVLALAVCLALTRRYRQALLLLLAEPLADGLNLLLKIAIDRQFPGTDTTVSLDRLNDLLFPSGHVVRTTVTLGLLVAFLAWPRPRLRWPATIAALGFLGAVGVAQVSVGGHLPLDVVGGFLLGAVVVNVLVVIDLAWRQRNIRALAPRVIVVHPKSRLPRVGLPRTAPALGVATLLVVAALGLRAPQRLWHLATPPSSLPHALVVASAPVHEWLSRLRSLA